MDAWTLHWLEAPGGLAEFRQALTGEFDIACQAISRYLPAQHTLAIALDKGWIHTPLQEPASWLLQVIGDIKLSSAHHVTATFPRYCPRQ